jgi:EpsI family protein
MRQGRPQYLLIILLLLAAHWLAYSVQHGLKKPVVFPAPNPSLVPFDLEGWHGHAEELDPLSLRALKPDAYLMREYVKDSELALNLTVLFAKGKSDFHAPELHLTGEGWSIISRSKVKVPLPGSHRQVNMTRLVLQKDRSRMLMFYSFLSPGRSDADWSAFHYLFLWQRLQNRQPQGALLQISAPVFTSEEETARNLLLFYAKIDPYLLRFLSRVISK